MGVYTRKFLRQQLGLLHIHDTLVSNTSGSCGTGVFAYVIDYRQADLSMSSEAGTAFGRAFLRINGMDLRVASFNCGSGAFVTMQQMGTVVPSGAEYEVAELISPADKDRALTFTVGRLTKRMDYPVAGIDGTKRYTIPDDVSRVLDAWYLEYPDNSSDQGRRRFAWYGLSAGASGGRELRIEPAIGGSCQMILDAITTMTLGPEDTDAIELPAPEWLLYGAEAICWSMLAKTGPGQETSRYLQNASRANSAFGRLSGIHSPQVDEKLRLDWPI